MKLESLLMDLARELDRVHPHGEVDVGTLDSQALPTFVTAESGEERFFTKSALRTIAAINRSLYQNNERVRGLMREAKHRALVMQAAADCHAAGELDLSRHDATQGKVALKARVLASVAALQTTFTHYFPAWTMGIEKSRRFVIGPITFMTRDQWLRSVRLRNTTLQGLSAGRAGGKGWKERVSSLLAGKSPSQVDDMLVNAVHDAVKDCPSVLRVKVSGNERVLSEQRARHACQTALDSLALLFQGATKHRQFVLRDLRLTPAFRSSLIESNGNLVLPGWSIDPRGWMGSEVDALEAVTDPESRKILSASGKVIRALLDPASSRHPKLAQRWALALAVCAEGCREQGDGLALALLGSSLDILSGVGMEGGILVMMAHLTGWKETDVVIKDPSSLTLAKVVERIYGYGRSQFLHGNHIDAMKPFDYERGLATILAKDALRNTVVRLSRYKGADTAEAFRAM